MSAGVRFSQRVANIAREKRFGMIKLAWDGRFMPDDEDKFAISIEGPASKEKIEMMREFMQKIQSIPNEPKPAPSESVGGQESHD